MNKHMKPIWTKKDILDMYKMNVLNDYTEIERALILIATETELIPIENAVSFETEAFCTLNIENVVETILDRNEKVEVYILHSHPTESEEVMEGIAKLGLAEHIETLMAFPSAGDILFAQETNIALMATKLVTRTRYFVIAGETITEFNYGYIEEKTKNNVFEIISKMSIDKKVNRRFIADILVSIYALRGIEIDPEKIVNRINKVLIDKLFEIGGTNDSK